MTYKSLQIQLLLAFILILMPATLTAQYIDGEFTITITESTYSPTKNDHKDMTTTTTVIRGQVNGKIFRDRVDRYLKNPATRMTECNPSTNCPVFTCSSDNSVLRANYSNTPPLKQYPFNVQATRTSNGLKWVNKKNGNSQEKYLQTERFSASGENSVDILNLNIIAYIAPSGQLGPLVPSYEMQFDIGTPLYKLREHAYGEGEWLRWDDEEEKLVPVNEPLSIGVLAKVDPSRKSDEEIYEPLLIKNYHEFDEFMLDPTDKIFTIQTSGKRYLKSYYSEYERQIEVVINLAPLGFLRKPQVALSGCSELGVSEKGQVTAKASTEGGTYRFWAEPQEIMTVESDGASATLQGSTPGRGKLYVEYTSPDGKTTTASMEAACVKVESYNGGQAVPQIPLFDGDGKKLEGILKVSVEAQPKEATDLLAFSAADPGVLSAVGLGDVVVLQGIHAGRTTVQATTKCGGTAGPPVEVEVVNCDDETVAALERQKQAAMKNLLEANDELKRIAGSKEFEKAREEIVKSLWDVFLKSGLTIVTSGKASGAQKVATEIVDNGNALREIITSSNPEELKNNVGKTATGKSFEKIVKNQFGEVIEGLWGKSVSAAIGVIEAQEAAQKFADNLNGTIDFERAVKFALENFEKCNKDLEKYTRLQQICRGENPQPSQKEAPKTEPKPGPTKPTPPVTPATKTEEPPVQKSQTEESTADDDVLVDPEPPVTPPRQVGLPYEADDCGCEKSKDLTLKSTDFSMLEVGMKNLGECVEDFRSTSLTDYQQALEELSTLTESLSGILNTDAAAFLLKAKESMPQLDSIVNRVKAYDEAGSAFIKKMDKCPESLTTGMEIFQSVEKITVDSIKTNY